MIELDGLTKAYRARVAVDDLTVTVEPGRVTGFLGPNGSGKTTTLRCILGLTRPTSGTATVLGRPFRELAQPMRRVGALIDPRARHPGRTAYAHLLALAQSNDLPAARVDDVIDLVGLESVAHERVRGFSLGMGQRLGIAAALLGDPDVLLLDEPVNGLDPEGIRWVRELLRDLADEGRTVLVSSHLMAEMEDTADHLIVLGRGRLLADVPMEDLLGAHAVVRVRTPAGAAARRRTAAGGRRGGARGRRRAAGGGAGRRSGRGRRVRDRCARARAVPADRVPGGRVPGAHRRRGRVPGSGMP